MSFKLNKTEMMSHDDSLQWNDPCMTQMAHPKATVQGDIKF